MAGVENCQTQLIYNLDFHISWLCANSCLAHMVAERKNLTNRFSIRVPHYWRIWADIHGGLRSVVLISRSERVSICVAEMGFKRQPSSTRVAQMDTLLTRNSLTGHQCHCSSHHSSASQQKESGLLCEWGICTDIVVQAAASSLPERKQPQGSRSDYNNFPFIGKSQQVDAGNEHSSHLEMTAWTHRFTGFASFIGGSGSSIRYDESLGN